MAIMFHSRRFREYDFDTRHQQLHFLERREQDFEEQAMHLKSGGCPANSVVSNPIGGWMDHGILPKNTWKHMTNLVN